MYKTINFKGGTEKGEGNKFAKRGIVNCAVGDL